ncbi:MAG TPA: hypothetical protein VFB39_06765 [Solirubrobacteraceae bacterium]|nr:hypothetical protein [Solirubrobacteraceae bacterium]
MPPRQLINDHYPRPGTYLTRDPIATLGYGLHGDRSGWKTTAERHPIPFERLDRRQVIVKEQFSALLHGACQPDVALVIDHHPSMTGGVRNRNQNHLHPKDHLTASNGGALWRITTP